ncbi:MAG: hypothetical protein FWB91_11445 [Defluviitaleaceae bacterium]|nr:hypothetical protein [Defluviitaleaceae bacterium]
MNNTPVLFTRKVLDNFLASFSTESVPNCSAKYGEMKNRWKKAAEKCNLQKTKETGAQGEFLGKVFWRCFGLCNFHGGA